MARTTPGVGEPAPGFTLPDQDGTKVNLAGLKQWVVLYFYPKDDTPGCTLEAVEFTRLLPEFTKRKAVVLGVSADTAEKHCAFRAKHGLEVRLLTDADHTVMEQYGAWGNKKLYGKSFLGITRSTFLIDPKGRIAAAWPKVKASGHAQEVLDTLDRLTRGTD